MKVAKLILVSSDANSNKFYNMKQLDSNTWEANWGRVGTPGRTMKYAMHDWDSKHREKVRGGYVDQTHLFAKPDPKAPQVQIKLPQVKRLVDCLLDYARETVSRNYIVSSEAVTQPMIDEAQAIIDGLVAYSAQPKIDFQAANEKLLVLYRALPRKMRKVQEHLLTSSDRKLFNSKISEEQNLLDVMAGQIKAPVVKNQKPDEDILAALGLEITDATAADIKVVEKMMGSDSRLLKNLYNVTHAATRKQLGNRTTELQWHGSRNENWWNILKTGLKIRPANAIHTGSMFGNGIYHSNVFKKSQGYTSYEGSYWAKGSSKQAFLAVNEVYTGNKLICTKHNSDFQSMTWDKLRKRGDYHSVHAPKGYDLRNDETIVYREDQVSIKFLLEIG